MYAQGSVEFRLATLHRLKLNSIQRQHEFFLGRMLTTILFAVGIGKITDQSRDNIIKEGTKSLERIFDLLDLQSRTPQTEREEKEQREKIAANQKEYLKTLQSVGKFNSLEQLAGAVTALNETIKEAAQKNSNQ